MISVIVYGRNDSHGYNLHKRAAISLNCIAEVLTDPDDEILFTDYNTPDELPTFPEAIADTLTSAARERLRILRVRPRHHAQFAGKSHLPVLEAIARNVALRRANTANRWVLATNTDMVLRVDGGCGSLSSVARELQDGFYHTARFEVPESIWESFSRSDPAGIIQSLGRIAPALHLHDVALCDDDIMFDCPGDFQLMLQSDLVAIDGFHEGMLLGWHLDSNIARRLRLHRSPVASLLDRVHAYHCDHTRQGTLTHGSDRVENNIVAYVDRVEHAELPRQRSVWGLANEEVEEVKLTARNETWLVQAVSRAVDAPQEGFRTVALRKERYNELDYEPRHALPFVLDLFATAPKDFRLAVCAMGTELATLLTAASNPETDLVVECADFPWLSKLDSVRTTPLAALIAQADAFLFEIQQPQDAGADEAALLVEAFERVVDAELARAAEGQKPRRLVCVNGVNNAFHQIWRESVLYTHTPFSTRVMHGFVQRISPPKAGVFTAPMAAASISLARGGTPAIRDEPEAYCAMVQSLSAPPDPKARAWAHAYAAAPWLLSLLKNPGGRAFLDLTEDKADLLRRELEHPPTPRLPGRRPPPLREGRSGSLARFACVEDWEDPAFARWVRRALGGRERANWLTRDCWVWERLALLTAADTLCATRQSRRALVLAARPEPLAAMLAAYRFDTVCGHVCDLVGAESGEDWRSGVSVPELLPSRPLRWFAPGAKQKFDLVLMPHSCFALGEAQCGELIAHAANLLDEGGALLLTAAVALGAPGSDWAFAPEIALEDRLAAALEAAGPMQRVSAFDPSVSTLTALRIGEAGEQTAARAFIGPAPESAISALFGFVRTGESELDPSALTSALNLARTKFTPAKQRQLTTLGPLLDRFELASGVQRTPLGLRVEPGVTTSPFAWCGLEGLAAGRYQIRVEARVRGEASGSLRLALYNGDTLVQAAEVSAEALRAEAIVLDFESPRGETELKVELALDGLADLEVCEAVLD